MMLTYARLMIICLALTGFATSGQIPPGYYNAATGLSGVALKNALHGIIDDHAILSYAAVTDALRDIDEDTLNPANVICFYTGWSYPKTSFGNDGNQWNREHVWSASHGGFTDDPPEYTDLHHLRPCDASVNSAKSNRDFSDGLVRYIDGSGPTDCYTAEYRWEPRPSDRGDVARIMFYMAVRYEGDNGERNLELVRYVNTATSNQPLYGNLDTLMLWHNLDPVDDWERDRNDAIYNNYQGNRNPFIDHPEYAGLIWGEGPVNHVTNFSAHDINLAWDEPASGLLPDGYLVRMSDSGFSSISDPVDGIPVTDDTNNINVQYGTAHCTFKGAGAGVTYYFKIFPFKGEGEAINYKSDGDIRQVAITIE